MSTLDNIMVDLETLSTAPNAMILSIGAVAFDVPFKPGTVKEFYVEIDLSSYNNTTLFDFSPATVQWWMGQSEEARQLFTPKETDLPLTEALEQFSDFVFVHAGATPKVWGNGASFDNVIMSNAFKICGVRQPWQFWNDRCYRTVKNLYKEIPYEFEGTPHNALDDAYNQAAHLARISEIKKLELK